MPEWWAGLMGREPAPGSPGGHLVTNQDTLRPSYNDDDDRNEKPGSGKEEKQ